MAKKKAEPEVRLRKDPLIWKKLPTSVRIALNDGVARVARVRAAIAAASKVGWMPSVQCVPEVWVHKGGEGSVDGLMAPVRDRADWVLCATLPAQTIVCDDNVVRRVLVHEFAHAFDLFTKIVDHMDAGRQDALEYGHDDDDGAEHDDDDGAEHDDAHLAPPGDWFSDEDAASFIRWNSGIGDQIHARMFEVALPEHLPVRSPERHYTIGGIAIPALVIARVHELRAAKGGK